MWQVIRSAGFLACAGWLLGSAASAQVFQNTPGQIPQGNPFNNSYSENVDFGDVDLDGDFDAAFADGGDVGNDQNRIWINLGGAQGGTIGFFADETAARCPNVQDASRDVEFADYDGDGDLDLAIANHSGLTNQSNRFWTNQGGLQGGATGFYVDETSTRWVGLGGPGSSVPPSQVLASGGFVTFCGDVELADFDGDGDLDLLSTDYGNAFSGNLPTRIFLNDGQGAFYELNPLGGGFAGGQPGLWCEGVQQSNTLNSTGASCDIACAGVDSDVGDADGDLDLDVLLGDRQNPPRMAHNRLHDTGLPAFRDVTGAVFPPGYATGNGHYEQEMGDLDNDDDLDVWGVNWKIAGAFYFDGTLENLGNGTYGPPVVIAGTQSDENEVDFLDYDNDGDLDGYLADFSGQDGLFRNDWTGAGFSFTDVTAGNVPNTTTTSLDADCCDVDADGDYDVFITNDAGQPNEFFQNVTQIADVHASRVAHLEQAPNRNASPAPTAVGVQVNGNADYYVTWYDATALEYSLNGGPFTAAPMEMSGGQVFRGEIPGTLLGTIAYRARSTDRYGNVGLSAAKTYIASPGPCAGGVSVYCTGKVNSLGCTPGISYEGYPSAGAGSGFTIRCANVLQSKNGLFFYSTSGANNAPFQGGFLCSQAPHVRTPVQSSGGASACGGLLEIDFNAWISSGIDPALVLGASFWGQFWYRDPSASFTTGLSDAITGTICP